MRVLLTWNLQLINSSLLSLLSQREYCSAAFARVPVGFGLDEGGARAYACEAAPFERAAVRRVEPSAVVFEREREGVFVVEAYAHTDARGVRVTADVADGLLNYPVNLHLRAGREAQALFQPFVTTELVREPKPLRHVRERARERAFERGGEAHVFENRGREVFADAPNLLRDRLYLRTQLGRVYDGGGRRLNHPAAADLCGSLVALHLVRGEGEARGERGAG